MKPIAIITAIMLAITTLLSGFSTEEVHAYEKTAFKTGDVIQFGSYLGEKLTWTVIDMDENGNPLLFADKLIGSRAYDAPNFTNKTTYTWRSKTENNTSSVKLGARFEWGVSALRDWLNSEESDAAAIKFTKDVNPYDNGDYNGYIKGESGFLSDQNFTVAEKDLIKPVANKSYLIQYEDYRKLKEGGSEYIEVPNDVWNISDVQNFYDNAYYRTVTDRVFSISLAEYLKAFDTLGDAVVDADMLDSAKDQLIAKYNFSRPVITYQLRDPMMRENELAPFNLLMPSDKVSSPTDIGGYTGAPEDPGVNIQFNHYGVRPACWLDLSKIAARSGNGSKNSPFVLNNATGTDEAVSSAIKIIIDGKIVSFTKISGTPFVDKASRTQVPLRVTMESYGANVGWDASTKTATVEKDGDTVQIPIGQKYIAVNGKKQIIDTAAQIVNNKTYLPIRSVVESLAGQVSWDPQLKSVVINNIWSMVGSSPAAVDEEPYDGNFSPGQIVRVKADPRVGFNYDYLIYISKNVRSEKPGDIILEMVNTGQIASDATLLYQAGMKGIQSNGTSEIANSIGGFVIMPLVERPVQDMMVYTHALDSDSVVNLAGRYAQVDKQVVAMVEHARGLITHNGLMAENQVITYGFSAAGQFAHRFAILHPEKVKAVAAGGLGSQITLPVSNYKEIENLDYPIGSAGVSFNKTRYMSIPQFIFQGSNDQNEVVKYLDSYTKQQMDQYGQLAGTGTNAERWAKMVEIHNELGSNITFKVYAGLGHEMNSAVISDVIEFIKKNQ